MYEQVKSLLQKAGELMIRVADGETFELHLHNTKFDDQKKAIILETGVETYWINADQVVFVWLHRKKK